MKTVHITAKQAMDLIYHNHEEKRADYEKIFAKLFENADNYGSHEYLLMPEGCKILVKRIYSHCYEILLSGYAQDGRDVDDALKRIQ